MKELRAAIFDLDGTILNTLADLCDSLNEVLAEEGLPGHSQDHCRLMIGNGLETLVVRSLPEGLRLAAHVRPIFTKFLERYRQKQLDKTAPYPGIPEMLAQLRARGILLAVLSNKAHPNALVVVEHYFPGTFQAVYGLRPEVPAKPDPAGALAIARDFNLRPEDFAFLGDSGVDMKTAVQANMFPVGVNWGYRGEEELLAAGAKKIIGSPAEFVDLFND